MFWFIACIVLLAFYILGQGVVVDFWLWMVEYDLIRLKDVDSSIDFTMLIVFYAGCFSGALFVLFFVFGFLNGVGKSRYKG